MSKKIRKILRALYKPFRFAIVKPVENSAGYRSFETRVLIPLRRYGELFIRERIKRLPCFRRCVIIGIDGGLGNQMCQYSMGKGIERESALPVYYDLSWFKRRGMDINNQFSRNYELEATFPRIRLRTAGPLITAVYRKFFKVYNDNMEAYARIASSEEPRYIAGFYRTRLDDEEARSDFVFGLDLSDANKAVLSEIEASECAVAVHVRRGDYAGFAFEVTDSNYFKESIALTADRAAPRTPIFFVFSDGMDWCRKNFTGISENLVFAENNDNDHGPADMYLMSRCHHFILSRSTFSYWSAFLSTRAPDKMMIWPGKRS